MVETISAGQTGLCRCSTFVEIGGAPMAQLLPVPDDIIASRAMRSGRARHEGSSSQAGGLTARRSGVPDHPVRGQ